MKEGWGDLQSSWVLVGVSGEIEYKVMFLKHLDNSYTTHEYNSERQYSDKLGNYVHTSKQNMVIAHKLCFA